LQNKIDPPFSCFTREKASGAKKSLYRAFYAEIDAYSRAQKCQNPDGFTVFREKKI